MHSTNQWRQFVERKKGVLADKEETIINLRHKILLAKKNYRKHEQALEIIKEVGKKTQEQLKFQMSDIVSLALESVMDDPYTLVMDFVERRNKIECDLLFEKDGERMQPLDDSGGGTADVASFALRVASWSLQLPKTRNTIILDEPFKFLDKSKHNKASQIIKEISKKLGIQFIIITHEEKLAEAADRIFKVTKKRKVSSVQQLT